jgi:UDP:flavonoid glycosyltransferase YjiC (YdhE family)
MKITILTLGSRGDVQPYVALGRGLAAAGHTVTLATHACWEAFVREHGLEFGAVAGDPRGTLEGEAGQMWLASDRNPFRFLRGMADIGRPLLWQMADDYWAACQAQPADLILFTVLAALPATAIAEKLGVPAYPAYLQHVHTTATYPNALFPPAPRLGPVYNQLTYALGSELFWRAVRPAVSAWRHERLGLTPLPRRNQFPVWSRSRQPCFYGFSPAILPRAPEWGEHIHITGYWFLPASAGWQPPPGLADFLASGPPPVFIGFGSMTGRNPEQTTALMLAALARSRRRGLLLTGWGGLKPADLPDDVYAIESAPFDWLFPRMAAIVHHGGAGTTGAALAAGKPAVVVPFFGDQHFWGWRVATLGAGPQPIPKRQLSVERLAAAITEAATSTAIRSRAAALGERIRAEDGVAAVVKVLAESIGGAL